MDIIDRLKDPELYVDAVDDAIAEIKRLRSLTEWQPIESAPKDGTRIILGYAGDSVSAEGYWMKDPSQNHWGETGWFDSDEEVLWNHPYSPTHWMPLPVPPSA